MAARIVVTAVTQRIGDRNASYLLYTCQIGSTLDRDISPEDLGSRGRRQFFAGLDNSNLEAVIDRTTAQTLLL